MTVQPESSPVDAVSQAEELEFRPKHIEPVPLRDIICLSQIRDQENPQYAHLRASIILNGLDNPPNITRPTRWQLHEYIQFTNYAWGSSTQIEEFDEHEQPDGTYLLGVAGHNRLAALVDIANIREAATGQPSNPLVWCKIEPDASVEGIVSVQTAENLHARPRSEREAMAAVALYLHGLGKKWQSGEEFIDQNKDRVNPVLLKDGLLFSRLSPQLRGLVFGRHIPYMAGIELGKVSDLARKLFALEAGIGPESVDDQETAAELDAAVQDKLLTIAAHIINSPKKMNSTAAQNYVKGAGRVLMAEIDKYEDNAEEAGSEQGFLFSELLVSAAQQARTIRRREQTRKAKLIAEIGSQPFATTAELMILLAGTDRTDIVTGVVSDTREADMKFASYLQEQV